MEALVKSLPSRYQHAAKVVTWIMLCGTVASVIVQANADGDSLQIADVWATTSTMMGQILLLWRLLREPEATAGYVSVQTVGVLALCHFLRLLELPPGGSPSGDPSMNTAQALCPMLLAFATASSFAAALFHRRRLPIKVPQCVDDPVFVSCGQPLGFSAIRMVFAKLALDDSPWAGPVAALLGHLLLPLCSLALAGIIELVVLAAVPGGDGHPSRGMMADTRAALQALAMLPQLVALRHLRVKDKFDVVVPPDLRYWLCAQGVGHLFATMTVLYSWSSDSGHSPRVRRTLATIACREGLNVVILCDVLVAHFASKWRGDKRLVLSR